LFNLFLFVTEVEKLGVTYGLQDPNLEVDQIDDNGESPIATVNDNVA
jgi:hypothetical protein